MSNPRPPFRCVPKIEAGAKMPSSRSIIETDYSVYKAAKVGSARLRDAILLYLERGGR